MGWNRVQVDSMMNEINVWHMFFFLEHLEHAVLLFCLVTARSRDWRRSRPDWFKSARNEVKCRVKSDHDERLALVVLFQKEERSSFIYHHVSLLAVYLYYNAGRSRIYLT